MLHWSLKWDLPDNAGPELVSGGGGCIVDAVAAYLATTQAVEVIVRVDGEAFLLPRN